MSAAQLCRDLKAAGVPSRQAFYIARNAALLRSARASMVHPLEQKEKMRTLADSLLKLAEYEEPRKYDNAQS